MRQFFALDNLGDLSGLRLPNRGKEQGPAL